jgi:alpha-1,3-rhamnosyl/mannosyltransferase
MRVVINAYTTIGNKTGVGRYTDELIRCLRERMNLDELFAYPHLWLRNLRARWKKRTDGNAPTFQQTTKRRWLPSPRRLAVGALRPLGHGLIWLYNRAVLRQGKFDLYHEPNHIPIRCDVPTVTTIHDLSVMHHPEWHPQQRLRFFNANMHRAICQTQHFFTVSDFVKREIAETFHVPLSRITTTPNGVRSGLRPMAEDEFRPILKQLGLPDRYLLHVGTIEPRKNLLNLMRAYVDLPVGLRERFPLVLVGQWGWHFEEAADFYHSTAKHKNVIQIGYVPDEALPAIYNGARALVFPTYYEGFGIPAVEMMGCGGAVLASTAGAVAEVVGKHAELIEPEDVVGWRDAMCRVLTDVEWWLSLRRGVVDHARQYSWDRTAAQTLRIYRQLTQSDTIVADTPAQAA